MLDVWRFQVKHAAGDGRVTTAARSNPPFRSRVLEIIKIYIRPQSRPVVIIYNTPKYSRDVQTCKEQAFFGGSEYRQGICFVPI